MFRPMLLEGLGLLLLASPLANSARAEEIQVLPPLRPSVAKDVSAPSQLPSNLPAATEPQKSSQESAAPSANCGAAFGSVQQWPVWNLWGDGQQAMGPLPRVSVRRFFGDGVGYDSGFTGLEAFVPFSLGCNDVVFSDWRVTNFDNGQYWEVNAGGGYRMLLPRVGLVAGLNGYYDGRNTDVRFYSQLGTGWELLGANRESRGNVYIPVGPQSASLGTVGFDARFFGTNIALNRTQLVESTMGGVDVEVGRRLPLLERFEPKAFVGYYHYSNNGVQTANGIRGRLQAALTDRLLVNLAVQNDAVFNTTVTGGLTFQFGGTPRRFSDDPLTAQLVARVVRDPNIVITRQEQTHSEVAIDPATGKPIEVLHADSSAPAGGNGSVERPFSTLGQLQTGSSPGVILFAHAGSVFAGQSITLQPGQRFLGEGVPHYFTSQAGMLQLPRTTSATGLPIISGSPGNAIVLASNTEVAGLQVVNAGTDGIAGKGVSNVRITDNIVTGSAANAISLVDVTGQAFVLRNVAHGGTNGVLVNVNSGQLLTQIAANNVTGTAGVNVNANGTGVVFTQIAGNTIKSTGLPDIVLSQLGATSFLTVESSNAAAGLFGGGLLGVLNLNTATSLTATTSGQMFLVPYGSLGFVP